MNRHQNIQATVTEILDLLVTHGDTYVVGRLRAYRDRLEQQDPSVIPTLLSEATGSIGSLRDRYLSVSNGDRITASEQDSVNVRLLALITRPAEEARPVRTSDIHS